MAVASWLAIFPLIIAFRVVLAPILNGMSIWLQSLVLTGLLTPAMTWLAMPAMTRLLRRFLYPGAGPLVKAIIFVTSFLLNTLPSSAEPLHMVEIGPLAVAGGRIEHCAIGYRVYGKLSPDRTNAVLIPTWLSGRSADLEGLIGPGKLLDSSRFYVIAVDALGDGVSCSPSNTARQPRMRFPAYGIPDMVEAQHRLVTRVLGIAKLHAVIGISMGGMQAIEWAASHPDELDRAVSIVGTPQPTSQDLLVWAAEMRAIAESADWRDGNYRGSPGFRALSAIHALALGTPAGRSAATTRTAFPAFLRTIDAGTLKSFEAVDWYRQLDAMAAYDAARNDGGSIDTLAHRLVPPILFVTSEHDHLVDPGPARVLATAMSARLLELNGNCGHLAPVCELGTLTPVVAEFLR